MINLSFDELILVAQIRNISDYKIKSSLKNQIKLSEPKPETPKPKPKKTKTRSKTRRTKNKSKN